MTELTIRPVQYRVAAGGLWGDMLRDNDGTPVAVVVAKSPDPDNETGLLLTVACPLCGGLHTHEANTAPSAPVWDVRPAPCSYGPARTRTGCWGYAVLPVGNRELEDFLRQQAESCSALTPGGDHCEAAAVFGGVCVEHYTAMDTEEGVRVRFRYPLLGLIFTHDTKEN